MLFRSDDQEILRGLLAELDADGTPLDGLGIEDIDALAASLKGEPDGTGGTDEGSSSQDGTYTNKIVIPIYEPKGDKPAVTELYDETKTVELKKQIEAAGLPSDIAYFLKVAADRHTSFSFKRIAEYYAHAPAEVQDLMERSGLVIIDYNKAIEFGFVKLSERLAALAGQEETNDEG